MEHRLSTNAGACFSIFAEIIEVEQHASHCTKSTGVVAISVRCHEWSMELEKQFSKTGNPNVDDQLMTDTNR